MEKGTALKSLLKSDALSCFFTEALLFRPESVSAVAVQDGNSVIVYRKSHKFKNVMELHKMEALC